MKKKISKILGVAITITMLASLMIVAAPAAAADPLIWNAELGPGAVPFYNRNPGNDVADFAIGNDGLTIYAVTGTDNYTYKSANAGSTWTRLTKVFAFLPDVVAVAPDDVSMVAVADSTGAVWLSTNGGTSFSDLGQTIVGTISDVAISPASATLHYIVAVGDNTSGSSRIAYFNFGATLPAWTNAITGTGWGSGAAPSGATAIRTVEFSPAFASDKVMLVISENSTTDAYLEVASFAFKRWNIEAGFSGYPATVVTGSPVAPLRSASLDLAPTYLGADEAERIVFVGIADVGTTGGVFRFNNTTKKGLSTAAINSVAYDGSNLVAGAYASNAVYRSSNPLAAVPTLIPASTYQKPGGPASTAVVVGWAGDNVVAGTSGTSSAFAVSKDDGKSFNDVSMVDDAVTNINDIALSADGSTIYMLTDDGTTLSLWKKTTAWERIFSRTDTGYRIRLDPANANNVYLIDLASTAMYYSNDGGETSWMLRAAAAIPVDGAVESGEVIYILTSSGTVYKSINSGFTWGPPRVTGIAGATIVSISEDNLLVGGSSAALAYSVNGATSWKTKTLTALSGAVQVTASGLTSDDYIYAVSASDVDIMRWKVGSVVSTDLADIGNITGAGRGIHLANGVLYIVTSNTSESGVYRNISPSSPVAFLGWDNTMSASANFTRGPRAGEITTGSTKLWTINNLATDARQSYVDDIADVGPTLNSPAADSISGVNPVTGRASEVIFTWSRLSKATAYSLEIAYDSAFLEDVTTIALSTTVQAVGPFQSGSAQVELQPGTTYNWRVKVTTPVASPWSETRSFTITSIEDPFSLAGPAVGSSDVSITPLLTWDEYPGAIGYELALSEDPSFQIVEWVRNVGNNFYSVEDALGYSTTFYWRVRAVTGPGTGDRGSWVTGVFNTAAEPVAVEEVVAPEPTIITITEPAPPGEIKIIEIPVQTVVQQSIPDYLLWTIIIIGGVLVISLIVLIVRTRRVA